MTDVFIAHDVGFNDSKTVRVNVQVLWLNVDYPN